jgi:protein FRG1
MPVKPLSFKGDKKTKKRKHRDTDDPTPTSNALTTQPQQDDEDEDDTAWVTPDAASDLAGPTLIVLSTQPPTCLVSDANGSVFASRIENMIENNIETAEPHDVRQVWVSGSVAGSKDTSFKGSHGGYLSCDSLGVLGARREARGVEEGFVIEAVEGEERSRWRLKTAASKNEKGGERYLCAKVSGSGGDEEKKKVEIDIRGDAEAGDASTQVILKMQARFKPRLKQVKENKANEKVSRQELERVVGRRLEEDEVRRLKRAKKEGRYHEEILDVRVKGKHDKFA